MGFFIPDLAHMTSTVRQLLEKGAIWNWLPKHQVTFDKIKQILTAVMVISTFWPKPGENTTYRRIQATQNRFCHNSNKGRQHETHAMRIKQPNTHTPKMWTQMQISSMGYKEIRLLPTRTAALWDLDRPQAFGGSVLKGSKLNNWDNPRLMRFREKISMVKRVSSKTHWIADASSRSPVFSAAKLEDNPRDIEDAIHCLEISKGLALDIITEVAEDKANGKTATELLQTGKSQGELSTIWVP